MLANFNCTDLAILDAQGGIDARVAVPSRCYFNPTKDRPLEGARITVKDNIDVAGHKSTLCNRAWEDLYPPAEKHAACLQTIIDAGAIIVGKVKLQAMIMREEPLECVEYSAPFNPRGDGYQVPSGSSHASAASVASYEWLDYSFGSDSLLPAMNKSFLFTNMFSQRKWSQTRTLQRLFFHSSNNRHHRHCWCYRPVRVSIPSCFMWLHTDSFE